MPKTSKQSKSSKVPDYRLSYAKELPNDKTRWINVGAGWQKAKGISFQFDTVPVNWDGRLFAFEADDEKEDD
jgi:hypothetical protein